jgi:hypothetical protein
MGRSLYQYMIKVMWFINFIWCSSMISNRKLKSLLIQVMHDWMFNACEFRKSRIYQLCSLLVTLVRLCRYWKVKWRSHYSWNIHPRRDETWLRRKRWKEFYPLRASHDHILNHRYLPRETGTKINLFYDQMGIVKLWALIIHVNLKWISSSNLGGLILRAVEKKK